MSAFNLSSGPSSFGQNNQQPATTKPTLSLFSAPPSNSQSSGLFGNPSTQASTGVSQSQQTGGLFGSSFGASQAASQASQQQSSLFGNKLPVPGGSTTSQAQKPSLFLAPSNTGQVGVQQGQAPALQQTQRSSLFSGIAQPSLGSNVPPSQGTQTTQQSVPGVKIDVSNIRGTTKFSDLHEELQKQIEQIDNFIQQQIQFKEQCDAMMPSHAEAISTVPNDVQFLTGKVDAVEMALDNDSTSINQMKSVVHRDAEDARLSFRIIDNLKLPQQFHYHGGLSTSASAVKGISVDGGSDVQPADLMSYFIAAATEMTGTLDIYRKNVAEIETHLQTVEASAIAQSRQLMFSRGKDGSARSKDDQVRELAAVLREFEGGILGIADKVGEIRDSVQQLELKQSTYYRGSR